MVDVLQQRGVEFPGPPATPAWDGKVRAFLRDPDGISWRSAVPIDDRRIPVTIGLDVRVNIYRGVSV